MRWKPNPDAHSIGEWIYHVAGAECWFGSRMRQEDSTEEVLRLSQAARATFIDDSPFPFSSEEMTVEGVRNALELGASQIESIICNPTPAQLSMDIETVIGPIVPGVACLWRVAQHAAYHTGQIWLYRFDPGFPKS